MQEEKKELDELLIQAKKDEDKVVKIQARVKGFLARKLGNKEPEPVV